MDNKLTLTLNKEIIEAARKYAKKKKTSLSKLIENYLIAVTNSSKNSEIEISPLVKSLSGILKMGYKQDFKNRYPNYLKRKYN